MDYSDKNRISGHAIEDLILPKIKENINGVESAIAKYEGKSLFYAWLKLIRMQEEFINIYYENDKGKTKFVILYNDGFKKLRASEYAKIDTLPRGEINVPFPTLAERLMEKTCELCGKENTELVMHHIRKLSLLKGDTEWESLMLKRRRKTLAVCPQCMQSIIDYDKLNCKQ